MTETSQLGQTIFQQTDASGRSAFLARGPSPDQVLFAALGPAYYRYRAKWRAAQAFDLETAWPLHLDVDTNFTCNLGCLMCPLGTPGFPVAYDDKYLDIRLYDQVLAEGAEHGLAAIRLGLTGEPLLRPDILNFIRLAKARGVLDIMLITNGQLLTPATSRAMIEAGLTRLQVSLDAARPETYRRIRRGGDFYRVTRQILEFIELRHALGVSLPLLRVSFVKMSINASEAEDFQQFWADKADYISFQAYANLLERPDTAYFADPPQVNPDFRCSDPWLRLSLHVNGDLFPCCSDFGRLAPLGNAQTTTVAAVWQGKKAVRLRRLHRAGRWTDDPICRRCVNALKGPGAHQ